MIPSILKISFLKFVNLCKNLSKLDKLNDQESEGKILGLTKLKLTPYTKIAVPFLLGRSIRGLSFNKNLKKDLFGNFIHEIIKGRDEDMIIESLFSHLKNEKNSNAAISVGLKNNHNLAKYPAWALVMPWETITIEKKFNIYRKQFINSRSKHNVNVKKNKNLNDEDIFYSYEYAKSQYIQTKKLLENIKKEGFKPLRYDDSPKIFVLINNNEWRWCMSGEGNHRAYISSLLGNEAFECVIESIVDKKKISNFYNVKSGLYSYSEANFIFDSYFSGGESLRGIV
tara:strand:- start:1533 stop:2384 length:852 start_codon:yes stop_codon:yes gene_type:complete